MPSLHNKNFKWLIIVSLGLSVSFFILLHARQLNSVSHNRLYHAAGRQGADAVLSQLKGELANIQRIITAKPRQIIFIDKNNTVQTYTFRFNTLWKNGDPVVTNVSSFNFEYRNNTGSLLVSSHKQLSKVASVAYVACYSSGKSSVFTDSRVAFAN